MEIKRVGENKIRCALTEDEIRKMGFDIDEIIGNGEATQKFKNRGGTGEYQP
jgi:adapter protein MecA 1/2